MLHRLRPFVLLAAAAPLVAQDIRQQAATLTWPAYTDQQRWNRQVFLAVNLAATSIAYAKSRGQTVEDFGRASGEMYTPGWGPANSGTAIRAARGFLFNYASMPNTDATLVSATDTSATVRVRRNHVAMFGTTGAQYGVTVVEYDRFFDAVYGRIAEYLGVRYSARIEGDWSVVTFSGRGSNAISVFPERSTFAASVTAEQAIGAMTAGTYDVVFSPDGRFEVTAAGASKVRGRYSVWLDQVTIGEETGDWATGPCPTGTYRFTPQANGDVVLGRLSDTCEGRARFFGRRFVKK